MGARRETLLQHDPPPLAYVLDLLVIKPLTNLVTNLLNVMVFKIIEAFLVRFLPKHLVIPLASLRSSHDAQHQEHREATYLMYYQVLHSENLL